jgi:hypothetical protein
VLGLVGILKEVILRVFLQKKCFLAEKCSVKGAASREQKEICAHNDKPTTTTTLRLWEPQIAILVALSCNKYIFKNIF